MRKLVGTLFLAAVLLGCAESENKPFHSLIFVSNVDSDDISVIDAVTMEVTTLNATALSFGLNEPRNLAADGSGAVVYIPGRFSNNIVVLDASAPALEQEIAGTDFDEPYAVAFSATEAWVVNKKGGGSSVGSVTVINISSREVVTTIDDSSFSSPEGIAIANGKAYVANRGNGAVSIVSISTRSVLDTLMPGGEPRYAVATSGGEFVFISNSSGTITKIRTSDDAVVGTVGVYGSRNLALSPDGSKLYAGTQSNSIAIVNTGTSDITTLTVPGAFSIYGVAIARSGDRGFATDESRDVVYVFDAAMDTLLTAAGNPIELSVGSTPRALAAN